jgi:hypothetical protein
MKARKIPIPVTASTGLNGEEAPAGKGKPMEQLPPQEPRRTCDRFGHEVILTAKSARTKKPVVK